MAVELQQQVQHILDPLGIELQLQALDAIIRQVRQKRKSQAKALYARTRYQADPDYKQKVNERTSRRITSKYATDAEWRAKVREQQRQYYHSKKQVAM